MSEYNGCLCMCHEDWGGGSHPGQKCTCRGGEGYRDEL